MGGFIKDRALKTIAAYCAEAEESQARMTRGKEMVQLPRGQSCGAIFPHRTPRASLHCESVNTSNAQPHTIPPRHINLEFNMIKKKVELQPKMTKYVRWRQNSWSNMNLLSLPSSPPNRARRYIPVPLQGQPDRCIAKRNLTQAFGSPSGFGNRTALPLSVQQVAQSGRRVTLLIWQCNFS